MTQPQPQPKTAKLKTQDQAAAYLSSQGYKVAASTFGLHFRQGKIPRGADGHFSPEALLGYAHAHLTPAQTIKDEQSRQAVVSKTSAEAELKSVRAAREKIRLERELGRYLPREDFEDEMSRRAKFFKSEIEGFIIRKAGELIRLTRGSQESRAELIAWWNRETEDWMDAWSRQRDFSDDESDEDDAAITSHPSEA